MKKCRFILVICTIVILLSSCTTLSRLDAITDAVSISSTNYDKIGEAAIEEECYYFLGLGGRNLERAAMDELSKEKKKLKKNQELTNYVVTSSMKYMLFGTIIRKTVLVTADIVEIY